MLSFVELFFDNGLGDILALCEGLSASDHSDIITSFGVARAELTTTLIMKTAQWEVIPLKAAGLMHWDVELATTCAHECLQQFDRNPDDTKHHRVSVEFFSPRGPWRSEVQRFYFLLLVCHIMKTYNCYIIIFDIGSLKELPCWT